MADEMSGWARSLAEIPEVKRRLGIGQPFSAYPNLLDGWYVGIGPIDNFGRLALVGDAKTANLLVDALRAVSGQPEQQARAVDHKGLLG